MPNNINTSSARLKAARSRQSSRMAAASAPAVAREPAPTSEAPEERLPRRNRRLRQSRGPKGILAGAAALVVFAAGIWGGTQLCRTAQNAAGMTGAHPAPVGTAQTPAVSAEPQAAHTSDPTDEIITPPAEDAAEADPTPTPAPMAELRSVAGDWISDPDAETYAEVIRILDDGTCSMLTTMAPADSGLTGWRDGTWYTAPVGDGSYTYDGETIVFDLTTPSGQESYRYAVTWLGANRFNATIYYGDTTPYNLVFTRIPEE